MRIRSSIKPAMLRQVLFKGTLWALAGLGFLFVCSLFFLEQFGFAIFAFGFFLIVLGLLPYKKLKYLELNPHEILVLEEGLIYSQGKRRMNIPWNAIEKMDFRDTQNSYGITLHLKDGNLFLPYFSRSSFEALMDEKDDKDLKDFKDLKDVRDSKDIRNSPFRP